MAAGTTGEATNLRSTASRVAIADVDIPFWMVAIMIKWTFAAIPRVSIIFGIIGAIVGGGLMAILGHVPGLKM